MKKQKNKNCVLSKWKQNRKSIRKAVPMAIGISTEYPYKDVTYSCPVCKKLLHRDNHNCPNCGILVDWKCVPRQFSSLQGLENNGSHINKVDKVDLHLLNLQICSGVKKTSAEKELEDFDKELRLLQDENLEQKETINLYWKYNDILRKMISSASNGDYRLPLREWLLTLDSPSLHSKYNEDQEELKYSLHTNLVFLANLMGYRKELEDGSRIKRN